jgi:hypothetical protein
MLGEPGPGDGRIGRRGHQHQPVRKLAPEEVLEQGPAGAVGEWPHVLVVEGEEVEHDERGRAGQGELPGPGIGGVDALLQGGEVQPALPPQHQFPVEHHGGVELFEGGHDLGEVAGERPLLARLQHNPIGPPVGEAAETVELGLIGPAPTRRVREPSALTAIIGRSGNSTPGDPRRSSTHPATKADHHGWETVDRPWPRP